LSALRWVTLKFEEVDISAHAGHNLFDMPNNGAIRKDWNMIGGMLPSCCSAYEVWEPRHYVVCIL
jgi:hypothetical protein